MIFESLCIEGFKSLAHVEIHELSTINIFHGLNDTGKSNLLEAIDLFCQVMPLALSGGGSRVYLASVDLLPYSQAVFRLQETPPRTITWTAKLRLTPGTAPISVCLQMHEPSPLDLQEAEDGVALEISWPEGAPDESVLSQLASPRAGFHRVTAMRYFQVEPVGSTTHTQPISRARRSPITTINLKRTLVEAYAGLDEEKARRYEFLVQALEKHFQLPGFIARLSGQGDGQSYIVGFRRPGITKPLLIGSVGSGVQQLVLLLGQMLFNPARCVGIEEPEMNLSPEWQARLLNVFKDLVAPDTGVVEQLFITSHSLAFSPDSAGYYDVVYDPQAQATLITRLPLEERQKYFKVLGLTPSDGEELGPYLTPQKQITLPQRVIDDLGLKPYEPVFFVKEGIHWRLCTKVELVARIQAEEQAYADQENSV